MEHRDGPLLCSPQAVQPRPSRPGIDTFRIRKEGRWEEREGGLPLLLPELGCLAAYICYVLSVSICLC